MQFYEGSFEKKTINFMFVTGNDVIPSLSKTIWLYKRPSMHAQSFEIRALNDNLRENDSFVMTVQFAEAVCEQITR